MTVMAEKLKQAGVRVPPLTERVWREVKAHPGRTCKHIAQTLALTPKQASILLWNLERRGMVTSLPLFGKHTKQVKTYSTTLVTYELLPIQKSVKRQTQGACEAHLQCLDNACASGFTKT